MFFNETNIKKTNETQKKNNNRSNDAARADPWAPQVDNLGLLDFFDATWAALTEGPGASWLLKEPACFWFAAYIYSFLPLFIAHRRSLLTSELGVLAAR